MRTIKATFDLPNGTEFVINARFYLQASPHADGEIDCTGTEPEPGMSNFYSEFRYGGDTFKKQIRFDAERLEASLTIEESGEYEVSPRLSDDLEY